MINYQTGPNFGHRQEWKAYIRMGAVGGGWPGFFSIARTIKSVDYKIPPITLIEYL